MVQRRPTARFRAIKHVIDTADPMSLLSWGAPDDEYDYEVWLILDKLNDGRGDLRTIVQDVFRKQFSEDLGLQRCASLADAINEALNKVAESR